MKFLTSFLSILLSAILIAGTAFADQIVTTGAPYLKEKPYSQQGKTYGFVPRGTTLDVLEHTNKYYIKVNYNGQVGYISTKFVDYLSSGETSTDKIKTTGSPYLKELPYSQKGKTYGFVPKGTTLDVLEHTNKYYIKVNYNGQVGYISTKFVEYLSSSTPNPKPPSNSKKPSWEVTADKIIAQAKSLQGKVKYQYGKRDPAKLIFDCSSFTQYLFKQQGIDLRWGARVQYQDGTKIAKKDLRKGDLVFTSTSKTRNMSGVNKIGHVAIYIGDNKIIHALNPTKNVTINDLDETWYKQNYVGAARVIK